MYIKLSLSELNPADAEATKKDDPVPGCRSCYSGGDGVTLWSRGNFYVVTDSGEDDAAPPKTYAITHLVLIPQLQMMFTNLVEILTRLGP